VSVRIFTPTKEMVFAGHPPIGTAFVLLEEGIVPGQREHFVLEERIGRVPIHVEWSEAERPLIWLRTPPIEYGRVYDCGILYVSCDGSEWRRWYRSRRVRHAGGEAIMRLRRNE
jgi:hypothetical protein